MKRKAFLWFIAILAFSSVSVIAIKKLILREPAMEERLRSYEDERKRKKQKKSCFQRTKNKIRV